MTLAPIFLALTVAAASPANFPTPETSLKTLRREHPRLLATNADLARLKQQIQSDPATARYYGAVKQHAERCLRDRQVEYKIIGPRLLNESRKCLDHVFTLATVYRIDGDKRCRDRAIAEMLTAAGFKDWNPSHFLDTAEMTNALAIGYDWLFHELTPEQRKTIREAIVVKGLREGEKVYLRDGWWAKCSHNWNQVCNGGMTMGALAVGDEEPALAGYIVSAALRSLPRAMASFAPDGAWDEGPGYWNYATSYNCYMLAALESALGNDFGLAGAPGFSITGDFRIQMIGSSGLSFNYADGGDRTGGAWQMYWLARKFNNPLYSWHEREVVHSTSPQGLWWFDSRSAPPADAPLDRHFRHADVAMLRGNWTPSAVYVGFKGGDNKANHSHLELGMFVLDADGQRWAVDLGADDYNLPGYFGKQRWTYYRLSTEGQNTLLIGGRNQEPRAVAPIVAFQSKPEWAFAVADLSAAYQGQAKAVGRGVALRERRQVLVQDEIVDPVDSVVWQMHTLAQVTLEDSVAQLKIKDARLRAEIVAPAGAKFETASAKAPAPQKTNDGVTKLVVRLPRRPGKTTLAIAFTPGSAGQIAPPALSELSKWPQATKPSQPSKR